MSDLATKSPDNAFLYDTDQLNAIADEVIENL